MWSNQPKRWANYCIYVCVFSYSTENAASTSMSTSFSNLISQSSTVEFMTVRYYHCTTMYKLYVVVPVVIILIFLASFSDSLVAIVTIYVLVFTVRLHVIHCTVLPRPFCPSVRLSVCLSVRLTRALWQNEKSCAWIIIPRERSFILVFWQEEWLVGPSLLPEILGQTDRVGAKTPTFNRYSLIAPRP